ncbi:hypothetical protein EJ05DRAFT_539953 [Pseudovirgaria hyperparasitica]|uniref:Uncharacterized protein n=1 Tax=Pseudovirgaria hyperparasitica TaxID=470096 RepID=A0A6A6W0X2_9PEZI|nr:uncharacterized protein EJ05DRAFT_539953 [Pseudovirgaria hyperparasitica]KAF2756165.1 hypothetical protein EJ05DRAFT_539953 [Pseudovirgaria hyperparasitica]
MKASAARGSTRMGAPSRRGPFFMDSDDNEDDGTNDCEDYTMPQAPSFTREVAPMEDPLAARIAFMLSQDSTPLIDDLVKLYVSLGSVISRKEDASFIAEFEAELQGNSKRDFRIPTRVMTNQINNVLNEVSPAVGEGLTDDFNMLSMHESAEKLLRKARMRMSMLEDAEKRLQKQVENMALEQEVFRNEKRSFEQEKLAFEQQPKQSDFNQAGPSTTATRSDAEPIVFSYDFEEEDCLPFEAYVDIKSDSVREALSAALIKWRSHRNGGVKMMKQIAADRDPECVWTQMSGARKAGDWAKGLENACLQCEKLSRLCVVGNKGTLKLLPLHEDVRTTDDPGEIEFWKRKSILMKAANCGSNKKRKISAAY